MRAIWPVEDMGHFLKEFLNNLCKVLIDAGVDDTLVNIIYNYAYVALPQFMTETVVADAAENHNNDSNDDVIDETNNMIE